MKKITKEIRMPHTYIIIFGVVLLAWLLTFLLPQSRFDNKVITYQTATGETKSRSVVVPETFRYQYAFDQDKLQSTLKTLVNQDDTLGQIKVKKQDLQDLLEKKQETISQTDLDKIGLTEPVLYSLYKESIYDTSKKLKSHAGIWGTKDFYGFGVLNYLFEGLVTGDRGSSAVGIVAFILVIGGAFGVITRTGAIDNGIYAMLRVVKGYEIIIIPVMTILFSLGGATFGMSEVVIPLVLVITPIIVAMGYDSFVAVAITFVASQMGNATSWMTPSGVVIAQGIAGLPILSGATFRIIVWIIVTILTCVYITIYARKIKKNPESSAAYKFDEYWRSKKSEVADEDRKFTLGDALVLLVFAAGMVWLVWGAIKKGFYIPEMSSQFFVIGLLSGIIGVIFKLNGMKVNDIASSFQHGAADLAGTALVVGMAKGIILVLGGTDSTTPTVLNTVLHTVSEGLRTLPATISAVFMYAFQSIFNFFVTSNSGQAAITMPIMAPLSDLIGVPRQVSVLAYTLGSGFVDAIVPTSASLMGVLAAARVDWGTWAKWQIKMQGFFFAIGTIVISIAMLINFQ